MSTFADEVAALRGTRSATLKDLLRHPAFSRLLAAMTVSSLGDWVGFVAVTSLVTRLGGGAAGLAISGVMIARTLPAFLFGPVAGVLVDRLDRKKLMIGADIGRGTLYASMVFVDQLWAIYAISFVIECLSLVWSPARDASLPNLVPRRQLANANSIGLASTYGTLPLGGIVFTVLVGLSEWVGGRVPFMADRPEALALFLDAGTFAFSASMVAAIPIRTRLAAVHQRFDMARVWRDTVDGLRFLREDSVASAMTGGIVVAFAAVGAVLAIGPVFVANTLQAGASGWGIIVTAFGVGMAIGMAGSAQVVKLVEREVGFVWSLLAAAAALLLLATMPNLAWAAVLTVWLGAFCGLAWVGGYTLLQLNVADEFRGRTFGSLTVLARGVLFLSLSLFPALADLLERLMSSVLEGGDFFVGGQRFDLSGTRLALWVAASGVVAAGVTTRGLLKRYRLSRPVALTLVPKLRRPPATGLFIAFEGVEGAGKGTQIARAETYLKEQGLDVLVTREPGGTRPGERIRDVLLDPETGTLDARAEALLFAASRAQTVTTVIRPALADGKVVICDRYVDSSLAYQGWARGLGEQDVLTLNVWATQGLFPDLVVLLHLEPEKGLLRSTDRPDRMELEGNDFHSKVADAYLKIAEEHPERFVVIDADRAPDEIAVDIRAALDKTLADHAEHRDGDRPPIVAP
ncbi:MAG TPA: dTMP kinase [Actinomycetota bacterium]|nr:dTMP kinase [Actinomycetota bacterium]